MGNVVRDQFFSLIKFKVFKPILAITSIKFVAQTDTIHHLKSQQFGNDNGKQPSVGYITVLESCKLENYFGHVLLKDSPGNKFISNRRVGINKIEYSVQLYFVRNPFNYY